MVLTEARHVISTLSLDETPRYWSGTFSPVLADFSLAVGRKLTGGSCVSLLSDRAPGALHVRICNLPVSLQCRQYFSSILCGK